MCQRLVSARTGRRNLTNRYHLTTRPPDGPDGGGGRTSAPTPADEPVARTDRVVHRIDAAVQDLLNTPRAGRRPPGLADGRLDHAYALTVHKAQGQTSQITLVAAAPSMTRETAYTALSRGRLGNYLYLTPDPDTPTPTNPDTVGAWIADTSLAQTAHAIHRSGVHELATDLQSTALAAAASRPQMSGLGLAAQPLGHEAAGLGIGR